MIRVTRLNGTEIALNPDLIISAEARPDTMITMTNGERFIVKESIDALREKYIEFKRQSSPIFREVTFSPDD